MNLNEILYKTNEKTKGDFWKIHLYADGSGWVEGMGEEDSDEKFEFSVVEELEAWLENRKPNPTF